MRQPSWAGSVSRGVMSSVETCNVGSSAELGLWREKTSRALRPSCLQVEQDRKFSRRHSCFPETRGFSFDEFFLSNSFQDLQACLTSFLSLCLCCSSCPSYSLSRSLFLIPILLVSRGASSELSFVLFSPLNGRSHFTELTLWPSTQWKWHEKGLRSFVLWTSVIGRFAWNATRLISPAFMILAVAVLYSHHVTDILPVLSWVGPCKCHCIYMQTCKRHCFDRRDFCHD